MKIINGLWFLSLVITMIGCSENSGNMSQKLEKATPADSVLFYLAEMRVPEVRASLENDTTGHYEEKASQYIKGLKKGLESSVKLDRPYLDGYFAGVQMAIEINKFKEKYGVEMDESYYPAGMYDCLMNDSVIDEDKVRKIFYRLMDEFQGRVKTSVSRSNGQRFYTDSIDS